MPHLHHAVPSLQPTWPYSSSELFAPQRSSLVHKGCSWVSFLRAQCSSWIDTDSPLEAQRFESSSSYEQKGCHAEEHWQITASGSESWSVSVRPFRGRPRAVSHSILTIGRSLLILFVGQLSPLHWNLDLFNHLHGKWLMTYIDIIGNIGVHV